MPNAYEVGLGCARLQHFVAVLVALCIASPATLRAAVSTSPTTTIVTSSLSPSFAVQSVTFGANVTGTAPTGTLAFIDGAIAIPNCAAIPLTGLGDTRGAVCPTAALLIGTHAITAQYSGDGANAPSSATLFQTVLSTMPGTATIVSNPYGTPVLQGASLVGNTITGFGGNAVIQLGPIPASGVFQIDFDRLTLGPGNTLTIRSGAPDQAIEIINHDPNPAVIAGVIGGSNFFFDPPVMSVNSPSGITLHPGGVITNYTGLLVNTLAAGSWLAGAPLVNNGVLDGFDRLEIFAGRLTGSGEHRGNAITLHTFGNINNPTHGAHFLQNFLFVQTGHSNYVDLTIHAYGPDPQVVNIKVLGDANVWMPSTWPASKSWPANNAVVQPGQIRAAGVPDPAYGGGSMIIQSTGAMKLVDGGTSDLAFPGGVVLKSDVSVDFMGVGIDQGWTASGASFQGIFVEAPAIMSSIATIDAFSNDLNWVNFSTMPSTPVRAFRLTRNGDGTASFRSSDLVAPHLNTYSVLSETAASGGCWICLVNTHPVDMSGR